MRQGHGVRGGDRGAQRVSAGSLSFEFLFFLDNECRKRRTPAVDRKPAPLLQAFTMWTLMMHLFDSL